MITTLMRSLFAKLFVELTWPSFAKALNHAIDEMNNCETEIGRAVWRAQVNAILMSYAFAINMFIGQPENNKHDKNNRRRYYAER